MSDAIRKAGLPPCCKAHGLRKAAARRLAEAGCSAHEIMAVGGRKKTRRGERENGRTTADWRLGGVPAQRIERRPSIADKSCLTSPHGSYGLKVDSDVSSGIELRVRIRRNDAGRVIFFYDQRSGAPCRKIRAPDDGRSHPPAPA